MLFVAGYFQSSKVQRAGKEVFARIELPCACYTKSRQDAKQTYTSKVGIPL